MQNHGNPIEPTTTPDATPAPQPGVRTDLGAVEGARQATSAAQNNAINTADAAIASQQAAASHAQHEARIINVDESSPKPKPHQDPKDKKQNFDNAAAPERPLDPHKGKFIEKVLAALEMLRDKRNEAWNKMSDKEKMLDAITPSWLGMGIDKVKERTEVKDTLNEIKETHTKIDKLQTEVTNGDVSKLAELKTEITKLETLIDNPSLQHRAKDDPDLKEGLKEEGKYIEKANMVISTLNAVSRPEPAAAPSVDAAAEADRVASEAAANAFVPGRY